MSAKTRWKTAGGIVVVSDGIRREQNGVEKILCFREATGGLHGWLRVERLTRLRARRERVTRAGETG